MTTDPEWLARTMGELRDEIDNSPDYRAQREQTMSNNPYDEIRAVVQQHYDAGKCTVRWRNDARTAINALQRYAPDAPDAAAIEVACKRYRDLAPVSQATRSQATRATYSSRVTAAINLHRGTPTERWPDGAQVSFLLKLPGEELASVRALAEERGCSVRDVMRTAIRTELRDNPPSDSRGIPGAPRAQGMSTPRPHQGAEPSRRSGEVCEHLTVPGSQGYKPALRRQVGE